VGRSHDVPVRRGQGISRIQRRSCYDPPEFTCRWGDYSGATPDPGSNAYSNHGRVWLSNQWNVASLDSNGIDWRTYNWGTNVVPFVILSGPSPLFQKVTSFPVSWELGNEATQANINLRQAPWNGSMGPYAPWKTGVPAGSDTYAGSTGNTYCFQAEALDSVPESWGFTADRCAVVPLDDRALGASSGWSRRTGTGFFLDTFTRTTKLGKSLRRTGIHAKSAQIMVEKCPTCGSIKIYWNGVLKHTYNLHAGSVQKKVYLSAVSFSSVHVGTLKIVVSSSGKPVIIDGLGISAV
jgi:ribosomal protein L32